MDNFKQILKEEFGKFFEQFEFKDSQKHKSFLPTDKMKENAKKALIAVEKNDLTDVGGNEGSGKNKAKDIVNGEEISFPSLKRMKAFFDNNKSEYQKEKNSNKTMEDSGLMQSWNLWGGDEGVKFADDNIESLNDRNLSRKELRRSIFHGNDNAKRLVNNKYFRKR